MLYELYIHIIPFLIKEHLKHLHTELPKKSLKCEGRGKWSGDHPPDPPPANPIRLGLSQVGAHNFLFGPFLLTAAVFC